MHKTLKCAPGNGRWVVQDALEHGRYREADRRLSCYQAGAARDLQEEGGVKGNSQKPARISLSMIIAVLAIAFFVAVPTALPTVLFLVATMAYTLWHRIF